MTTIRLPPSRLDEAVHFFQDQVVPAMQPQPGLRGIWLLVNRSAGTQLAVGLWETAADLEASGFLYQELRAKIGELYAGPPVEDAFDARPPEQDLYEVRVHPQRAEGLARARVARVTMAHGAPERVEALFRQFQAQMAPVLERQRGYQGSYLFVGPATGKVASISLWESQEALEASDTAVGALWAQAAQTLGAHTAPTVVSYEVAVHPEATPAAAGAMP